MKKRVGDAEFAELCQRVEFGIREATCEFPNFSYHIYILGKKINDS